MLSRAAIDRLHEHQEHVPTAELRDSKSYVALRVHRPWTESFGDVEGRRALHSARAEMLHEMAEKLSLEVVSWGETDAAYPREFVEIVIAVTSGLITEAIAGTIREWFRRRKVKEVEVLSPSGTYGIAGLNAEEMAKLGKYLWELRSEGAASNGKESQA